MKQSLIIFVLVCCGCSLFSQAFEYRAILPYDIQAVRPDTSKGALNYLFYDQDQDNDMDLILMGYDSINFPVTYQGLFYFVDYQENIGNKTQPLFREREDFMSDFAFLDGLFFPSIGDLNGDNRMDWIIHGEIDSIGNQYPLYYQALENQGYQILRLAEFGLEPMVPRSFFFPHLTDLDMDGDLDILLSGAYPPFDTISNNYEPVILYAKNIGSSVSPKFLGWYDNPYGLEPNEFMTPLISGDIDLDGDIDLLGIESRGDRSPIYYYENIGGSDGKPDFADPVESPFGLPKAGEEDQYLSHSLVDIDGDRDLDYFVFLIGEESGGLLFYENNLLSTSINKEYSTSGNELRELIKIYPNPSRSEILIENNSQLHMSSIHVYDLEGKLVKAIDNHRMHSFRLNGLENGIYVVKLKIGNGLIHSKIVIQ